MRGKCTFEGIFFNIMFFFQIFNTKWVSSSRDVVALRQSMLRADKSAEFRAYVATKGETLESDVLFWLEVQKYKVTCLLCDKFSFLRGGREGGREGDRHTVESDVLFWLKCRNISHINQMQYKYLDR